MLHKLCQKPQREATHCGSRAHALPCCRLHMRNMCNTSQQASVCAPVVVDHAKCVKATRQVGLGLMLPIEAATISIWSGFRSKCSAAPLPVGPRTPKDRDSSRTRRYLNFSLSLKIWSRGAMSPRFCDMPSTTMKRRFRRNLQVGQLQYLGREACRTQGGHVHSLRAEV